MLKASTLPHRDKLLLRLLEDGWSEEQVRYIISAESLEWRTQFWSDYEELKDDWFPPITS